MQDQQLQRKLEQVDIMESQIYMHEALTSDDYKDMLKFAEVLHQTTGEILKYIKHEAKIYDQNKYWR